MNKKIVLFRHHSWLIEFFTWILFYITVHFNVNDEKYSFFMSMKFIIAIPQALFCVIAVYSFHLFYYQSLESSIIKLIIYILATFILMHLVYYYSLEAAQPYAPLKSVSYRRWFFLMRDQGPFYFLYNWHYLVTVSSQMYFSMICLPLSLKLLRNGLRESQLLAISQRQQAEVELATIRHRLNPIFFQNTLKQITDSIDANRPQIAADIILKLAQVVRHTLYEGSNVYTPLQGELNAYLDYIYLQELRLQGKVDLTLHLTVEGAEQAFTLSSILLPITEQWFNLIHSIGEVELRVRNSHLTLSLRADANTALSGYVLEIQSIQERLKRYIGVSYCLVSKQENNEISFMLDMPLLNKADIGEVVK